MSAKIIDGKAIAEEMRAEIKTEAQKLKAEHGVTPGLAVVLVGQDPASHALMRQVVPRPVMFVIDKVFGPRYRRKSARLWGGTRAAVVPALDKQLKEVTP